MTDTFGRSIDYLRISVTDRCNLRCVYCMPSQGIRWVPHENILRFEEIVRLTRLLTALGVRRVRLTGGEPLVRAGVIDLISALNALPGIEEIGLTTNGVCFAPLAEPLRQAGLSRVNFSLDTLNADTFRRITGTGRFSEARAGLDAALAAGFPSVKMNSVLMRGVNDGEAPALAALAKDTPLAVRFIEMMPIGCGRQFAAVPTAALRAQLEAAFGPAEPFSGHLGSGPAEYITFSGFRGQVGFISAMSHEFCQQCNRVRLTAEGYLKLCLHYSAGADLRTPLRAGADDAALSELLRKTILQKPEHHCFASGAGADEERRNMNAIGG